MFSRISRNRDIQLTASLPLLFRVM